MLEIQMLEVLSRKGSFCVERSRVDVSYIKRPFIRNMNREKTCFKMQRNWQLGEEIISRSVYATRESISKEMTV